MDTNQPSQPNRVSIFTPIAETAVNASKKIAGVGKKVVELFQPVHYVAEETPKPVVVKPKVKQTVSDIHGPYHTLETGTTLRDVPKNLQPIVQSVYQKYPELPKGLVESILQQESNMGKVKSKYNPKIGEYAWLVGFTPIAKKELVRHGIVPDLSSPQGAINAMADYIAIKQNIRDDFGKTVGKRTDPMEIYDEVYSSGRLKPETLAMFKDLLSYYGN